MSPRRAPSAFSDKNAPEVEAAFAAAPDTLLAQIIEGELHTQPRPTRAHTVAASHLGALLVGFFSFGRGGPGGWIILDEPELHLGPRPDKVVPDIAGWRRERMVQVVGSEDTPPYFELAPDWICEVLSPSTLRIDRIQKMRLYARECVPHVWLVDPVAQTLEVFRLEGDHYGLVATFEQEDEAHAEPFEAVVLPLKLLWG